jgi:hypothetical protein
MLSCSSPKSNEVIYKETIESYFNYVTYEPEKYVYESFEILDTIQVIGESRIWLLIDHKYAYPNQFGVTVPASMRFELMHYLGKDCLIFPEGETGEAYPNEYYP